LQKGLSREQLEDLIAKLRKSYVKILVEDKFGKNYEKYLVSAKLCSAGSRVFFINEFCVRRFCAG
jgi:hypothetical protein